MPTILVIEDNPDDLRVLANFIRDLGTVVFASNGSDGVRMAKESKPDLILLDIELPDIIGPVVYKQIRQETPHVPVIFVTSHTGMTHQIAAMESGAKDFVSKPFDPEVIRASIQTQLQNQPASDFKDRITQAFTREYFEEHLQRSWQELCQSQGSLVLAMVQLDNYQHYCDSFGSLKADASLKKVAGALSEGFSSHPTCLARYEHETFAHLSLNMAEENIDALGHWLVQTISNLGISHHHRPEQPVLTASVGLCFAQPKDKHQVSQVVEFAQAGLAEAQKGGNQFAVLKLL